MKETTLSRTTAQQREVTSYTSAAGEKTGQMHRHSSEPRLITTTMRNAPMNSMSNGAGRTARIWNTG